MYLRNKIPISQISVFIKAQLRDELFVFLLEENNNNKKQEFDNFYIIVYEHIRC
jgi:hypothetical protein